MKGTFAKWCKKRFFNLGVLGFWEFIYTYLLFFMIIENSNLRVGLKEGLALYLKRKCAKPSSFLFSLFIFSAFAMSYYCWIGIIILGLN